MSAATFTFKAVDGAGVPSKGEIKGPDKNAVTEELRSRGLQVMELVEKKSGLQMELSLGPKRVKAAELTVMTRQLATMISSGMTLLRAFYVLEDQLENQKLKETVGAVREDIESGIAFSEALAQHPKVFNPLYVAMVRAGEAGGVLEESLERVSDQLEKDDELRRQVKCAMAYPIVVLAFAMCVLLGLIAFIVPVFVGVFKDFGGDLPLITKFTVNMSKIVTGQWYLLLGGTVGIVVGFKKWRTVLVGPPAVGPPAPAHPLQDRPDRPEDRARALVADVRGALLRRRADHAGDRGDRPDRRQRRRRGGDGRRHRVRQVRRLDRRARSRTTPIFPSMVAQMIAVGEETGNLDSMLSKVADFYEDEVAAAVKALTSILEPIMIIFVGGIVGFIVIAMYMPMFKVYDAIQ